MATNVKPDELNYDGYEAEKYEDEIKRVIPGYEALHKEIEHTVKEYSKKNPVERVADLGIGTGLSTGRVLRVVSDAHLTAIDFSKTMMAGARKRLSKYNAEFILGDYAEIDFGKDFDIILSVIGLHHQNDQGKRKVFKKVFKSLKRGGLFIFGDLVTYKDEKKAAINDAKHYAFLVENAKDEAALKEWSHHHKFLNDPTPLEDQVKWLKDAGFSKVEVRYKYLNTVLIIAQK